LHFSHQPVFEEDRPIEDPTRGTNQLVRNWYTQGPCRVELTVLEYRRKCCGDVQGTDWKDYECHTAQEPESSSDLLILFNRNKNENEWCHAVSLHLWHPAIMHGIATDLRILLNNYADM
jgi:hypothetical protein